MSKKSNKKKTRNPMQWRWQLDVLLLLLTVSVLLWTVVKVQLIDMKIITQAYLPPIEEPTDLAVISHNKGWLESKEALMNPSIQKPEQDSAKAETAKEIAEAQEETIIVSVNEPKVEKKVEAWHETKTESKKVVNSPAKPAYVTSTEKIDKEASLTPTDEIF